MLLPDKQARDAGHAPLGLLIFLSLMTSVIALTIDAVMPAIDAISNDLSFPGESARQFIILLVFAGMGLGQPIFGPLSDALGRRQSALLGWLVFSIGTLLAMCASSTEMMLAGRFLQGFGAAGPRLVAMAIVRDLYEGRAMARILSLVMTVFMLVPMFAPMIGLGIEMLAGWRAIFVLYLSTAIISALWHFTSIPETLPTENRRPLSFYPLIMAYAEAFKTRQTICFTVACTCVFGTFCAYLAAAQHIYESLYDLGNLFPFIFTLLAGAFAIAQFTNSRVVMRFGMRRICRIGIMVMVCVSGLSSLAIASGAMAMVPPLWLFLSLMVPIFAALALVFVNTTALALAPLGHIAGTAAAVVTSISTLGAVPVGALIARQITNTVAPLFGGFFCLGILGFAAMWLADARPQK